MHETDWTALEYFLNRLEAKLEVTEKYAKDLDELLDDSRVEASLVDEPIRMIHHMACTGGTMFSKCIASMANVVVLNEVNPFHATIHDEIKFNPTDMVALIQQGDKSLATDELITEVFLKELEILHKQCWLTGRVLVLRDHTYSQFLIGDYNPEKPILREIIEERFRVLSFVTTRDTQKAFRSMSKQGWHKKFEPSTIEEYERRHDIFLKRFKDVPIIRYEDFCSQPKGKMREICEILDLTYFSDFEKVFSSFRFSGDSGRGGNTIISGR